MTCTEVIATSIEIKQDPFGLCATGLFLEHDTLSEGISKKRFHVRVKREIILCGGAIASHLLMLRFVNTESITVAFITTFTAGSALKVICVS